MKINTKYLMASAANPGLLPLAFKNCESYAGLESSNGHHKHTHSGNIEHSFKDGTGEELRGFSVNSDRAAKAYRNALALLEEWRGKNIETIEQMDSEIQEKIDEWKKEEKEKEEAWKLLHEEHIKKREAYLSIQDRLFDLRKAKKNSWFFSHSEELSKLEKISNDYLYDRSIFYFGFYEFYFPKFEKYENEIKKVSREIGDKLKVSEFAQGNIDLSRADVLELASYEMGDFLEKLWFVKSVHERKQKNFNDIRQNA